METTLITLQPDCEWNDQEMSAERALDRLLVGWTKQSPLMILTLLMRHHVYTSDPLPADTQHDNGLTSTSQWALNLLLTHCYEALDEDGIGSDDPVALRRKRAEWKYQLWKLKLLKVPDGKWNMWTTPINRDIVVGLVSCRFICILSGKNTIIFIW